MQTPAINVSCEPQLPEELEALEELVLVLDESGDDVVGSPKGLTVLGVPLDELLPASGPCVK
jgi:hypothetical protein